MSAARGRRGGFAADRILTFGERVPRSVGAVILAMGVASIAKEIHRPIWSWLSLDGARIFQGQVWRLVTWVLPQSDLLSLLFAGFVLHWLGRELAAARGERGFLAAFFGYAAWSAAWTALVWLVAGDEWQGARIAHVGAWPVVNALLAGWAFSRPGAQMSIFGLVSMTAQAFAWIVVGGTIVVAVVSPGGPGEYLPHLAALALVFLGRSGFRPRRLWLRAKERWIQRELKRRRRHLQSVPGGRGEPPKKTWMN